MKRRSQQAAKSDDCHSTAKCEPGEHKNKSQAEHGTPHSLPISLDLCWEFRKRDQ